MGDVTLSDPAPRLSPPIDVLMPNRASGVRYPALDSLRGLAAVIVVFWHAALIIYSPESIPLWIIYSPFRMLISGPPVVMLFFLLSGFVLSISFLNKGDFKYLPFAIKRIFRIWLPFAVVILVSAIACKLLVSIQVPEARPWFRLTWYIGSTFANIVQHLAMTGTANDLDNPMWSLWHELRISLIFPILVFLTFRWWKTVLVATLLLAVLSLKLQNGLLDMTFKKSFLSTITFMPLFIAGIATAMHHDTLSRRMNELPSGTMSLLWLLGLILIVGPFDGHSQLEYFRRDFIPNLFLPGLGSALVTALALTNTREVTLLLKPIPLFLGRISYSLYLTHVVVFAIVIRLLHTLVGLDIAIAASLIVVFPVAYYCNRFVEVPAMRIGRKIAVSLTLLPVSTTGRTE